MKARIYITTTFAAVHYWPGAREPYQFLGNPHRHVFHVRCTSRVLAHNDRELEFLDLKGRVDRFLQRTLEGRVVTMSCEHMAESLLEHFAELDKVEVSEDGENGAEVERG